MLKYAEKILLVTIVLLIKYIYLAQKIILFTNRGLRSDIL